jgi:hypothetical protein
MAHNLGEYVEKAVIVHRGCLTSAPDEATAGGEDAPPGELPAAAPAREPVGLRDVCGRERALVSRTLDRHAAVHELLQAGRSQREAAEILGLSRNTVNRFARQADAAGLLVKATSRESKLDPFKPWINRRWNQGLTRPGRVSPDDQARLAEIKARCPHLDALAGHVRSFAEMMTCRQGRFRLRGVCSYEAARCGEAGSGTHWMGAPRRCCAVHP